MVAYYHYCYCEYLWVLDSWIVPWMRVDAQALECSLVVPTRVFVVFGRLFVDVVWRIESLVANRGRLATTPSWSFRSRPWIRSESIDVVLAPIWKRRLSWIRPILERLVVR